MADDPKPPDMKAIAARTAEIVGGRNLKAAVQISTWFFDIVSISASE
jgi:hypothetical protein